MSDYQAGPGWWQASDGLWYSPETLPPAPPIYPPQRYTRPPPYMQPPPLDHPPRGWEEPPARQRVHGCLWGAVGGATALVLLIVIVAVVIGTAAHNASKSELGSGSDAHPAADDLTVTRCDRDTVNLPEMAGKVTNHSSKRSIYFINVTFEDPASGSQLGSGGDIVDDLEPGQSADWSARSFQDFPSTFRCRVSKVARLSA